MSWICCQLGAREHYAVPRALNQFAQLEYLITDTWVVPGSPLAMNARLKGRFHPDLAHAPVAAENAKTFLFEARTRARRGAGRGPTIARNRYFQRLAIERLRRLDDRSDRIIMAYSYAARDIFEYARARGWRTILGQIDPGAFEDRLIKAVDGDLPIGRAEAAADDEYFRLWHEECALSDVIVVNSEWSRVGLIEDGMDADRIVVIPLAYSAPSASVGFVRDYPSAFNRERPLRCLFLGQVNKRKGVQPLFNAIRRLVDAPVTFDFVGAVGLAVPEDIAAMRHVCFHGPVPRDAADRFYKEADVFLFPTLSDGFGITQIEARAWKLPVIASANCGDVVVDGGNGLRLPSVDKFSIENAIRLLLQDVALAKSLANADDKLHRFSLSTVGNHWLSLQS